MAWSAYIATTATVSSLRSAADPLKIFSGLLSRIIALVKFLRFIITTGNLYGLEKFWAFLKFRKDKRPVPFSDELRDILKGFQTLEDFHAAGEVFLCL